MDILADCFNAFSLSLSTRAGISPKDIDSIVVNQVSPNVVEFSFRVVMPDANLYIKGSVPISATSVGATVSPAATGFGAGEFGGGNFGG